MSQNDPTGMLPIPDEGYSFMELLRDLMYDGPHAGTALDPRTNVEHRVLGDPNWYWGDRRLERSQWDHRPDMMSRITPEELSRLQIQADSKRGASPYARWLLDYYTDYGRMP